MQIRAIIKGLAGVALMFAAFLMLALPAEAGIRSSEEDAGTKSGSRLRTEDRIVIWPKGILPGGARDSNLANFNSQCTTLYNRTGIDYFVPWATDDEWNAFLAARALGSLNTPMGTVDMGRCCWPELATVCGVQIPPTHGVGPEKDTNLGQRLAASRNLPSNPEDLHYYGALLDVKALQSQVLLNDNLINYEVTYMCDHDGTWTKTREVGSCVPIDGACNTDYTSKPQAAMPALPNQPQLLCAQGSILHDKGDGTYLTGTGPWSWQCDGTPGRAPALCQADYNGCNVTLIPEKGLKKLPTVLSNLCLAGNTVINLTPAAGNGPWDWQCRKNDNGHISTCHAAFDPSVDGICNPARTGTPQSTVPLAKTDLCIDSDTLGTTAAIADAVCDNVKCTWSCAGSNGGVNKACTANRQQQPGQCGLLASTTPIVKPAESDPGLCAQGTPTTVSGTVNGATWNWSCVGSPNPVSTACSAPNIAASVVGVCGMPVGKLYTTASPPTLSDTELCAAGTPTSITKVGLGGAAEAWTWICLGQNDGANSGLCSIQYFPNYAGPQCGTANKATFVTQPTAGLCAAGNVVSEMTATTSPRGWSWKCDDALYPGSPVSCAAKSTIQPVAGSCGSAHNGQFGNFSAPPAADKLCNNGGTPIALTWPADPDMVASVTWGCAGQNGGADTAATACRGTFIPPLDGACGVAVNWTPSTQSIIETAAPNKLCQPSPASTPGNFAAYYDPVTPGNSKITWTCSKANATGKPASCSALYVPAKKNGECGEIPGSIIAGKPSDSVLCKAGLPYNYTAPNPGSGPGIVRWACSGLFGGDGVTCQQEGIEVVNPNGQCGKAHGAYVPDRPNYNLCAAGGGTPSAVTGEGPWKWTCGTDKVACEAYPCKLCSGTLNRGITNMLHGTRMTKTMEQCVLRGQPGWAADAQLQLSNDTPVTLSWQDSFNGAVHLSVPPTAAPEQYCSPCYMRPIRLIEGETGASVQKVSGVCPAGMGTAAIILPGINLSPH